MHVPLWAWIVFGAVVVTMLAIDLLAHRGEKSHSFRSAAIWSGVWVGVSLIFAGIIALTLGSQAGTEFTTAYLLEKSLSVDNLFVFALIFGYFKVPKAYQHRVLFFGVIGALVMRGLLLAAGVAVVSSFVAIFFVFAALLLWSAWKLVRGGDEDGFDPGRSLAVRMLSKVMPVADEYHCRRFFIKEAGKRIATPLFAVVVAIEAADLLFAVDSVPAVLAVSDDAFIVYASNAFAILGLRALYFLLAGLLDRFHLLDKALAFVLAFIGVKLLMQAGHETISHSIPEIPTWLSLGVIVVALTAAVVGSLRHQPPSASVEAEADDSDIEHEPPAELAETGVSRP